MKVHQCLGGKKKENKHLTSLIFFISEQFWGSKKPQQMQTYRKSQQYYNTTWFKKWGQLSELSCHTVLLPCAIQRFFPCLNPVQVILSYKVGALGIFLSWQVKRLSSVSYNFAVEPGLALKCRKAQKLWDYLETIKKLDWEKAKCTAYPHQDSLVQCSQLVHGSEFWL